MIMFLINKNHHRKTEDFLKYKIYLTKIRREYLKTSRELMKLRRIYRPSIARLVYLKISYSTNTREEMELSTHLKLLNKFQIE